MERKTIEFIIKNNIMAKTTTIALWKFGKDLKKITK